MAKPGTTRVEKHIRSLFPDDVISRVQVLEYGDDPAVEPGDVAVRVFLHRPDQPGGGEADEEIVGSNESQGARRLADSGCGGRRQVSTLGSWALSPDERPCPCR